MRALLLFALLLPAATTAASAHEATIARDRWGIAHVNGRTDADAVFGMIYAQAEDDFPRIEANYLTALGRTAEAEGEGALWQDLRARLYVSPARLQAYHRQSPAWLKTLAGAWAAGLNAYLRDHPHVRPRVLTRFEPWMAFAFTEGSIGGDIERIDLEALAAFYGNEAPKTATAALADLEPRGSNGIAIAPALTAAGRPLLLINPHTSFYFRAEQQVTSAEGLNAYGAATWGQFFIYQGFNANAGWMHTSSGVDSVDEFVLDVRPGRSPSYRFGRSWQPFASETVALRFKRADGSMAERRFRIWRSRHGPVVRSERGRWVSFAMMDRPVEALQQSFLRTKARSLPEFLKVAALAANSSNATLFADGLGNIAYLHPQFVPRRDHRFDYAKPVNGSDPATRWQGLHRLSDLPSVINPASGFAFNTNNWPYTAAGAGTLRPTSFPAYMDRAGENARGLHALRLLAGQRGWTPETLRAAAYDRDLPAFDVLLPPLFAAFDRADAATQRRLEEPVRMLRAWDRRWGIDSEATSLAVHWGEALPGNPRSWSAFAASAKDPANAPALLAALDRAVERMKREQGGWRVPWGRINRFQRIDPAIRPVFDDAAPSLPVGFTSGVWGSLASMGTVTPPGSSKRYGNNGNSFVAVVEFGPRVRAMALSAGGQSGDPASPHFRDQAHLYPEGRLRPVYFYPDELRGNITRTKVVR